MLKLFKGDQFGSLCNCLYLTRLALDLSNLKFVAQEGDLEPVDRSDAPRTSGDWHPLKNRRVDYRQKELWDSSLLFSLP